MKKVELSDAASNLLVFSSIAVAIAPFVLGDRLVLIASSALHESAILLTELSTYMTSILS